MILCSHVLNCVLNSNKILTKKPSGHRRAEPEPDEPQDGDGSNEVIGQVVQREFGRHNPRLRQEQDQRFVQELFGRRFQKVFRLFRRR